MSSINRLKDYQKRLVAESKELFEESGGAIATMLPDFMRSREAIEYRDQIALAANSTLKELFGGNLSDGERESAAREFYNDALGAEQNARILDSKIKELEAVLKSKQEKASHYEKHKTLSNWEGSKAGLTSTGPAPSSGAVSPENNNKIEMYMKANPSVSKEKAAAILRMRGVIK
jgi:hypothetical protein